MHAFFSRKLRKAGVLQVVCIFHICLAVQLPNGLSEARASKTRKYHQVKGVLKISYIYNRHRGT